MRLALCAQICKARPRAALSLWLELGAVAFSGTDEKLLFGGSGSGWSEPRELRRKTPAEEFALAGMAGPLRYALLARRALHESGALKAAADECGWGGDKLCSARGEQEFAEDLIWAMASGLPRRENFYAWQRRARLCSAEPRWSREWAQECAMAALESGKPEHAGWILAMPALARMDPQGQKRAWGEWSAACADLWAGNSSRMERWLQAASPIRPEFRIQRAKGAAKSGGNWALSHFVRGGRGGGDSSHDLGGFSEGFGPYRGRCRPVEDFFDAALSGGSACFGQSALMLALMGFKPTAQHARAALQTDESRGMEILGYMDPQEARLGAGLACADLACDGKIAEALALSASLGKAGMDGSLVSPLWEFGPSMSDLYIAAFGRAPEGAAWEGMGSGRPWRIRGWPVAGSRQPMSLAPAAGAASGMGWVVLAGGDASQGPDGSKAGADAAYALARIRPAGPMSESVEAARKADPAFAGRLEAALLDLDSGEGRLGTRKARL